MRPEIGSAVKETAARGSLYTPEQRRRRDASVWTTVQAVLAPFQFAVFLLSLALVARYLITGAGGDVAAASVVVKTLTLYTIMVTGSIWEKVVFGKWLFADAFWWEDLFSMAVLALHTAYLVMLFAGIGSPVQQFAVALAGYAAYVINAGQFLWKLRVARLQGNSESGATLAVAQ
ncbi:2-vinyl bacteriochlorophyllide hydratase [Sphingomonas sp. SFZ2018-12]|uniref:2-vinyl bacteriochlorophyllide hydratase n=1 Tax=Sphingomonas sp. SFZ2018-12 TaxID=2683197 RepID=UPI001F0DEAC5|nr:2-vinyl bacteriochlorophyllide hydratase [Sphingomonas sp. SFZ2018-12]MCH4891976.1 2-vinyl bacteriochlorophyllide hydratase [Sphingomonas sp. SFZ2018-12]